jgi:hypothetical protein
LRPLWLIEAGVYGDEALPLLAEIRRQGMSAVVVPYEALRKEGPVVVDGQFVPAGSCVIGYGTLPFRRQIQLHHRWAPGAWYAPEKLDCAVYYAHFGKYLLNTNYVIMPGVEAIRQRDWLYSVFGTNNEVFIRPTSCHKLFVGRRVLRETFPQALAATRYDPETLVVVTAPRSIGREWRFVVAGDRVVAGSQYAMQGTRAIATECPEEVQVFAESILADVRRRPDRIFMLDIGESDGLLGVVERNSFSCSWLYACDLSAVVAEAAQLASRAWVASRES